MYAIYLNFMENIYCNYFAIFNQMAQFDVHKEVKPFLGYLIYSRMLTYFEVYYASLETPYILKLLVFKNVS